MPSKRSLATISAGTLAMVVAADLFAGSSAFALAGPAGSGAAPGFTAQITVGTDENSKRSCSGVLIDSDWVATAASCLAADPDNGTTVSPGAPKQTTTVTFAGGATATVANLVPRADRDLVLAQLDKSVTGVTPAKIATTAPATDNQVSVAGWGRTADQWVTGGARTGTATVTAVTGTTVDIDPGTGTAICAGDTGGPTLTGQDAAVVALNSRSWQGGCLGSTETRTGATQARVDNIADWIQQTTNPADAHGPVLKPGDILESGGQLTSATTAIKMQDDGNLVMFHKNAPKGVLWSSHTYGNPGAYLKMQDDGNLVVYKKDGGQGIGGAIWSSKTFGNPGAYLQLQDSDGNLVVYKKDGGEGVGGSLWATATNRHDAKLASGQHLSTSSWMDGKNTVLAMQEDGNLDLYRKSDGAVLWSTKTNNNPGAYTFMQPDGNFVVYKKGTSDAAGALFSTKTYGNNEAFFYVEDNGNLVVYKKNGGPGIGGNLWNSGSHI